MKPLQANIVASTHTIDLSQGASSLETGECSNEIIQLDSSPLSQLWCPFQSRINRHVELVYQGTYKWLEMFGLGGSAQSYKKSIAEVAYLAGRFHPDASPEILQLIADWYAWFFCLDDDSDGSDLGHRPVKLSALHSNLLLILRGATPSIEDGPLGLALRDLQLRSYQLASSEWLEQLTAHIVEYFAAIAWEANNRQQSIRPSLDSYIRLRPITGGLPIDQVFAKLSYGIELPFSLQSHPSVRQATMLADHAICCVNDLLSLEKELHQGDVHNLVMVLQYEQRIERTIAIGAVVSWHNSTVKDFFDISMSVASDIRKDDDVLQRYMQILQTRIAGHLDWANTALRYRTSTACA